MYLSITFYFDKQYLNWKEIDWAFPKAAGICDGAHITHVPQLTKSVRHVTTSSPDVCTEEPLRCTS